MTRRLRPVCHACRSGAAAVEMAVVLPLVLVPLLLGLWEIGRLVHVQQVVSTSAREGARLASQGSTINQTGSPTVIVTAIPPAGNTALAPNVKAAVVQSLTGSGLTGLSWDDVTVTFRFVDSPAGSVPGATEPYQGVKGQRFRVFVSVPYAKVRWVNFGLVNPDTVSYEVEWRVLVDDPFAVTTAMPSW